MALFIATGAAYPVRDGKLIMSEQMPSLESLHWKTADYYAYHVTRQKQPQTLHLYQKQNVWRLDIWARFNLRKKSSLAGFRKKNLKKKYLFRPDE
jgi:hypothetical protein